MGKAGRKSIMDLKTLRAYAAVAALVMGLGAFVLAGCAGSSVERTQVYGQMYRVVEPSVFLVYDFAAGPEDAIADTFGADYASDQEQSPEELEQARAVADAVSEQWVRLLLEKGIRAERASVSTVPEPNAIVAKGQFVTVEEGARGKRMLIGFGRGAEKLEVQVQVYQMTEAGLQRIVEAEAEAHGSKKPGMLIPIAAAAKTGKAAGAVIAGGMTVKSEVTGGLEANARRLAEDMAERVINFYEEQGWR
jgi:hypothetical protein